jgi:hypothetical protein
MKAVKKLRFFLIIILLLSIGFLIGNLFLDKINKSIFRKESRLYMLIHTPTGSFFDIYKSLSSDDELTRINGYYGAGEAGLVDSDFLVSRFKKEASQSVRRTILFQLRKIDINKYNTLIIEYPEFSDKQSRKTFQQSFQF